MADRDLDVWFVEEVLPLEPMLTRFLHRNWQNTADIQDIRQEVYARVCEAATNERPLLIKAFLFATARNLMIDRARRARVISMDVLTDLEAQNVPIDEDGPDRTVSTRQELRLLRRAIDDLPARVRDVIVLRKIEGLSQREVASQLGVTENSIEYYSNKGLRLLADAIFGLEVGEESRKVSGLTGNSRKSRD
jgi:RNA polymerase sigma-70 factor (ECF subfamily)